MEEETQKKPQVLDLSKVDMKGLEEQAKKMAGVGSLMDMDFEGMEKKADKIIKVIVDTHAMVKEIHEKLCPKE